MTRRLRLAASLLAVVAGVVLLVAPVGAAPATRIVDAGWWWKLQTGAVTQLPPPPNVEPGMLQVQGSIDDWQSIAAVAAELPDGHGSPILTLRVADGGDQGGAAAVVLACAAGSPWTGEHGGRWDSKPVADCASAVSGIRSEDGASWTFALGPLQSEDRIDVVIVPGTVDGAPEGANGSAFTLVFEEPAATDIATTPGTSPPDTGSAPSGGFSPPPAAGDDFGGPATDDFSSDFPETGSGSGLPDTGSLPAAPEQPTGGAPAPSDQAGGRDEAAAPVPAVSAPSSRTLARVLGGVVALLGLAGAVLATRTPAMAGAAASPDAPVTGGLGRFARERTAEPNAIS